MTHLDAITLLTATAGRPANKLVTREPDGSIRKEFAHNGRFTACTVPIPDVATLAAMLREVGERADQVISLSVFKDAPAGDFVVIPRKELAARLGVDPEDREALAGFHDIDGAPTAARVKQSMVPGDWVLFDRDAVPEMPAALARLSFEEWRAAIDLLFPGFAAAGCVVVPSTSTRVLVDGAPLASSAGHIFVKVDNPADLHRAWSQATLRALTAEVGGTPLAFARPKKCRKTGKVVATGWWTIYDKSVEAPARLVFDGAPTLHGAGLTLAPPDVQAYEGPALELARVADLSPRKEKAALEDAIEAIRGVRPSVNLTRKGGVGAVTGVEVVTADLTMDLEIKIERGWATVGELYEASAGHTRCQSPFRESCSWAAYYNTHRDGTPFLFDTGTSEKHVLAREGRASMSEVIRDWMASDYGLQFVGREGIYSSRLGRLVRLREITPTDALFDRLSMASDAPCDPSGQVKRLALPTQFSLWVKVAWGVLLRSLPTEDEADASSAEEGIRDQIAVLLTSMYRMNVYGGDTRSLGSWAYVFARMRPGKWCRVGSLELWGRILDDDGFLIAIRPKLATQTPRNFGELSLLSLNQLTRRCRKYGIARDGTNHLYCDGRELRAIVLSAEFVEELALDYSLDDPLAAAAGSRLGQEPDDREETRKSHGPPAARARRKPH